MKSRSIQEVIILSDGRKIIIGTGELARLAEGAALIRMGDTILLSTVVSTRTKEDYDFFPLTVEYREKYYAGGKIPAGFLKREVRHTDKEILIMRMVDRLLRPLLPKYLKSSIQIIISLLSYDDSVLPDGLAGLAASAALYLSDIPFAKPVGSVRIVRVNGKFIINPGYRERENSDIDMLIGGSKESIIMVEGEMKEISENEFIKTLKIAHAAIQKQIDAILRLAQRAEKYKRKKTSNYSYEYVYKKIHYYVYNKIYKVYKEILFPKQRTILYNEIFTEFKTKHEEFFKNELIIKRYFEYIKKQVVNTLIFNENLRLDGRAPSDIRTIYSIVNFLPGVHGAALFTRGETQALTTVTLGSSLDVNMIDTATIEEKEKFFVHYNFHPFSTGELKPRKGISRREIGHGNLAKRALKNIIPYDTPYTIRLVSEILGSNGSSSMATVCAGTLALMDAGIPLIRPVAGIAMGLIANYNDINKSVIIYDILGDEDHLGDMDFKIAGTAKGITACQMDMKISYISYTILKNMLSYARKGRLHILHEMLKTIELPRKNIKQHAPKISQFKITKKFIVDVIGGGGKIIQDIQSEFDVSISIEEIEELGLVEIVGKDNKKIDLALERIKTLAFVPRIGYVYEATVKSIKKFGVFVEIFPGKEYLLHISEINWERLVKDALKIGDKIKVKLIGRNKKNGKILISRKVLLFRPKKH